MNIWIVKKIYSELIENVKRDFSELLFEENIISEKITDIEKLYGVIEDCSKRFMIEIIKKTIKKGNVVDNNENINFIIDLIFEKICGYKTEKVNNCMIDIFEKELGSIFEKNERYFSIIEKINECLLKHLVETMGCKLFEHKMICEEITDKDKLKHLIKKICGNDLRNLIEHDLHIFDIDKLFDIDKHYLKYKNQIKEEKTEDKSYEFDLLELGIDLEIQPEIKHFTYLFDEFDHNYQYECRLDIIEQSRRELLKYLQQNKNDVEMELELCNVIDMMFEEVISGMPFILGELLTEQ
jgi:hypothetical protein